MLAFPTFGPDTLKGCAMNDEMLVSVLLPATRKAYDVWVPARFSARDASSLIAIVLSSRERSRRIAVRGNALMSEDTGGLLDPGCIIGDIGLPHKARLVLV